MRINTREFYCSSSGDKWLLRHDWSDERVYVKHVANPASGGHQTDYELHAFLNGPRTPERVALIRLIASLADSATAHDI